GSGRGCGGRRCVGGEGSARGSGSRDARRHASGPAAACHLELGRIRDGELLHADDGGTVNATITPIPRAFAPEPGGCQRPFTSRAVGPRPAVGARGTPVAWAPAREGRHASQVRAAGTADGGRGARVSAAQAVRAASRPVLAPEHRPGLPAPPRARASGPGRPPRSSGGLASPAGLPPDPTRRAGAAHLAHAPAELAAAVARRD